MIENSTTPSISRDYLLAVRRCMRKPLVFSGRAGGSEFWWWYLTLVIANVLISRALLALGLPLALRGLAQLVVSVAIAALTLAASSRRLHDAGHSAWNMLWCLTIVGSLYVLYLQIKPSQPGPNRFGPPEPLRPEAL